MFMSKLKKIADAFTVAKKDVLLDLENELLSTDLKDRINDMDYFQFIKMFNYYPEKEVEVMRIEIYDLLKKF